MKKLYIGLDTHKEKIVIGLAFAEIHFPDTDKIPILYSIPIEAS